MLKQYSGFSKGSCLGGGGGEINPRGVIPPSMCVALVYVALLFQLKSLSSHIRTTTYIAPCMLYKLTG